MAMIGEPSVQEEATSSATDARRVEADAGGGLHDPPGPRFWTPLGLPRELRESPLAYVTGVRRRYGRLSATRVGPFWSYMVVNPEHIKYVLQENNQNYWKGIVVGRVKPLIGEGLFSSDGDFWRRQRRLAQPAFHRQRIAALADLMTGAAAAMLDDWEPRARSGEPFDVSAEMSRVTLRVVGLTLFGIDLQEEAAEVGRALLEVLEFVNERAFRFLPPPVFFPTRQNLQFLRDRRSLDRVVYRIIDSRRRGGTEASDLLALLMAVQDEETGEAMSDRQLRDEVMTFVLAGHETTALALTWTWHLLAQHPEVEAKLCEEVVRVLGQRRPTAQDLDNLPYTRMVVQETMRLYPPLWAFVRQSIGRDEIGGFRIRARSIINIIPYITHRDPEVWDDPERFDPERFTPERVAARPRFAYIPFSGGPRQCIGNEFALMEAQLVTAMVMQRYRIRPLPDRVVEPEVRLTLRPKGGLHVKIEAA